MPITPTMNLLDILHPSCVRVPMLAGDKQGVIHELVDLLADAGRVTDRQGLKSAVWAREQTRTTGIGLGLAIPHGKAPGVPGLAMAIGKPAAPIDFQALDKQPVRLVVLLASPPDRTAEHIQALARVSRLMNMPEFRNQIYEATSAAEVIALLHTHETQ
ncbi:MAG: PTS sugar transporter subunit IIA [Planctomyces sp.]|nr:PTS sugar transporter subunit IIA [Planctomyces sp.]MBA4119702.1 PTS sugar transporter subunit IIA [Isosphaera sp.]